MVIVYAILKYKWLSDYFFQKYKKISIERLDYPHTARISSLWCEFIVFFKTNQMPYTFHMLILFFVALLLMLITKFVLNCTIRKYRTSVKFSIVMLNWHQIASKKRIILHHCRKLVQIMHHKGAGTKIKKCLVGYKLYTSTFEYHLYV